jgi:hypothetical protein
VDITCILGMHRSGTSLVSQLSHALGMYQGEEKELLIEETDDAPRGYWENRHFVALNDHLLSFYGWDCLRVPEEAVEEGRWYSLAAERPLFFQHCVETLWGQFSDHEWWGWKDPRTTLTLPFWKRVVHAAFPKAKLRFVYCVRNPREVEASFQRHRLKDPEETRRLWRLYNRAALTYLDKPFHVVSYGKLLAHPKEQLGALQRFYGRGQEHLPQALPLIQPSLRRYRAEDGYGIDRDGPSWRNGSATVL